MTRLLVFAVAAAGVSAISGCGTHTAAEIVAGAPRTSVQRVVAGPPVRKALRLATTQPGQIEPFERTALVPKISGYVDKIYVDIGDSVQQGQTLLTISSPEMLDDLEHHQAMVAQAEAAVLQGEAQIKAAKAMVKTSEARLEQLRASVTAAESTCKRWESEFARMSELGTKGSVTTKLVDETLNQLESAKATCEQAKAAVLTAEAAIEEAQANVEKAQADHSAAQAQLQVAEADKKRAETLLKYMKFTAPFDGVVTARHVDTGHYVQPAAIAGGKPLLVVARIDKVRIFVDVPEIEAASVQSGEQGAEAIVRVQALGNKEFEATVTRTAWSLDTANRSLLTVIDINNDTNLLRPGMYATATILLDQRDSALTLPLAAIVRQGGETFCYCVRGDHVQRQPIELGLRSGDDFEVVSGLSESDIVVLQQADGLVDGQTVEAAPPG